MNKILTLGYNSETIRQKDDFYATDPKAIDLLFEKELFDEYIWEPAAGLGHLSDRMKTHNKQVLETDLIQRKPNIIQEDFLTTNRVWAGDILTNPPFKFAKEFVYKSLEILEPGKKLALFLKIQFLETIERRKLFDIYPPKQIWVFSRRINTAIDGLDEYFDNGTCMCYAWYIWEKDYYKETKLGWL